MLEDKDYSNKQLYKLLLKIKIYIILIGGFLVGIASKLFGFL